MIWNKGLTKETDERVAKYAKTCSENYRKTHVHIPILEKRICPKCGKEFEIDLKKSNRKFCSRTCANGHKVSDETKQKISKGLNEYNKSSHNFVGVGELVNYVNNIEKLPKYHQNQLRKHFCIICGSIKGECPRPDVCKSHQLFKTLIKFGFNLDVKGTLKIIDEFDKVKHVIEEIYNTHPSDKELCENWGYTSGLSNFHKILKSLGIQTRNQSTSQYESLLLGKSKILSSPTPNYKQEWYITWENKKVFLRSSYEYDYAKYLDEQKISYDVERLKIEYFDTQQNKWRISIPDFYLPDTNEIIEIKSNWTLDIQNMKDKFLEYIRLGYNPKLILEHEEVDLYKL